MKAAWRRLFYRVEKKKPQQHWVCPFASVNRRCWLSSSSSSSSTSSPTSSPFYPRLLNASAPISWPASAGTPLEYARLSALCTKPRLSCFAAGMLSKRSGVSERSGSGEDMGVCSQAGSVWFHTSQLISRQHRGSLLHSARWHTSKLPHQLFFCFFLREGGKRGNVNMLIIPNNNNNTKTKANRLSVVRKKKEKKVTLRRRVWRFKTIQLRFVLRLIQLSLPAVSCGFHLKQHNVLCCFGGFFVSKDGTLSRGKK